MHRRTAVWYSLEEGVTRYRLFQLVDLTLMEWEAPAPATEIPGVHAGQIARFTVGGFTGRSSRACAAHQSRCGGQLAFDQDLSGRAQCRWRAAWRMFAQAC